MSKTIKSWGHAGGVESELIMKSDGEPALFAFRSAVMKYPGGIMIPEGPTKGEKAENGLIEEAGKTIREYFCTFLSQIEDGVDDVIPLDSDIIPWMVRWAVICYSRYAVGKDGRTSFERLRGRTCRAVVIPMGEKVWYKQRGDGGYPENRAETQWSSGVSLGPAPSNSETLVGTTEGVVRAYTIQRFGMTSKLDVNAILDMRRHPAAARPDEARHAHSSEYQNGAGGAVRHAEHETGSGRSSSKEVVCQEEAFRRSGVYGGLRGVCELVDGNEKQTTHRQV